MFFTHPRSEAELRSNMKLSYLPLNNEGVTVYGIYAYIQQYCTVLCIWHICTNTIIYSKQRPTAYRAYLFKGKCFFLRYFCLHHLHLILSLLNTFDTITMLFSPMLFWRTIKVVTLIGLRKLTFLKSIITILSLQNQ